MADMNYNIMHIYTVTKEKKKKKKSAGANNLTSILHYFAKIFCLMQDESGCMQV